MIMAVWIPVRTARFPLRLFVYENGIDEIRLLC